MNDVSHLLKVIDTYIKTSGVKDVTLSFWMFNDSKKLAALRAGSDITVGRYNAAMAWLSGKWPEGAEWPGDVARPFAERAA